MGWTVREDWRSRESALAEIRRDLQNDPNFKTLQMQTSGNRLWYIAQTPDGNLYIGLFLVKSMGEDGWAYKCMSESAGPVYYDCPVTYLSKVPDPGGYATNWRERVREHHTNRAKVRKRAAGGIFRYNDRYYRLYSRASAAGAWMVTELLDYGTPEQTDGRILRAGRHILNEAKWEPQND